MIGRAWRDARHPPVGDARFWLVQGLVLVIAGFHLLGDQVGVLRTTPFPASETVGLLLVPVAYAAAAFGLGPSVATALWSWVLWTPDLLLPRDEGQPVADVLELTLITAVAVLVGLHIERERAARAAAERADAEHRSAEHRYRSLLDAHASPTLLVDGTGTVVLANPAARTLFGEAVTGSPASALGIAVDRPDGAVDRPDGTVDWPTGGADGPAGTSGARGSARRLVVGSGGSARELRVQSTVVTGVGAPGEDAVQVVLHDVTPEAREGRTAHAYASDLVEVQEDEWRRISRELHDEPVQRLVHLSQRLLVAERAAGQDAAAGAALADPIRAARAEALEVIAELRALARGLRPPVLDDLGLIAAVEALLDEPGGTAARSLRVEGAPRRLAPAVELALFRIVQESLRNAERHSGAGRVTVSLAFAPDRCRATVTDDGRGLAADATPGLGLLGMRERAEAVGARLEVGPGPSGGTTVSVAVSGA